MLSAVFVSILVSSTASSEGSNDSNPNLAPLAKATASESLDAMLPNLAIDGNVNTRWSGIPGHNEGVWFELVWPKAVSIGQVVLRQYDRYVTELDIQTWDEASGSWKTQQHLGNATDRLPKVAVATFASVKIKKLRVGNIANGPSFTEVEVYGKPLPLQIVLGSDINGNIIGMVCDAAGSSPVASEKVKLAGEGAAGAWKASATSDQHGLFTVAMPLGLKGDVVVQGSSVKTVVDSTHLQYGLTPLSHKAKVSSLNGTWRFLLDPPEGFWKPTFDDKAWNDIQVPRSWEMEGFRSHSGIAAYRKSFTVPKGQGRLKLRFDGVYSGAEVWVNGQKVAYHEGGALPFEVDITGQVHEGTNLLALKVTEHTRTSDQLDKMSTYADVHLGGIIRKVTLFRVPEIHFGAIALATQWDKAYRNATIGGSVSILNESINNADHLTVTARLLDAMGNAIPVESKIADTSIKGWERKELPVEIHVPNPKGWNAEQPYLYTLKLEVRNGDKLVQELNTRWGFRQTEIRGSELLINGQPVKVKGTCHHDSDPLLGRAVTPEQDRLDIELMKEASLNSFRTSHYAALTEMMDAADELGMYVEDEGSFCWTGVSDDLTLTPHIMQLNCELVARDRNHPSVFTWSICNESTVGYGLWRSYDWVKKSDPSRPLTGSFTDDGTMDIAVRHNPITIKDMTEIDSQLKGKNPLAWDEAWCIWQDIYSDAEELWLDPGIRDYYIEPLPNVWKHFIKSPVVQITQIWAWSDDIFLLPGAGLEYGRQGTRTLFTHEPYTMPGRGVAGDAQWGVVDGWRRRKPEFWHTKKLQSPVKVEEKPLELSQTVRIPVSNEYDFLNLKDLHIAWSYAGLSGMAKADVAPHSDGVIVVSLSRTPKEGEVLGLAFSDSRGNVVDSYRLSFGKPVISPQPAKIAPKPLTRAEQHMLSGGTLFVTGNGFEFGFNAGSGALRRGVAGGHSVLRSMPDLHLLQTGEPMSPLADRSKWSMSNLKIEHDGENIKVTREGEYPLLRGQYTYIIHPDGVIDVHASFTYSGEEVKVRELGLVFDVPQDNDLLSWDRNGEHSVYPVDHIGRNKGEARSVAVHKKAIPPMWSWSEDNSPLGTNDFRSVKRHLNWGWIGLPDGPGVVIDSNGTQALRATFVGEHIEVCVNDFYGGIGGLWEWVGNYGQGQVIKKGQVIKASARLRLTVSK